MRTKARQNSIGTAPASTGIGPVFHKVAAVLAVALMLSLTMVSTASSQDDMASLTVTKIWVGGAGTATFSATPSAAATQ